MKGKQGPGRSGRTSYEESEHVLKRRRIAQSIAEHLIQVAGITSVAIIGSVATGDAREDSDIDLAATYRDTFDQKAFCAVCDHVGRDPQGIALSTDPLVSVTALLVEGVKVGLILGPESHLRDLAHRAGNESREKYRLCLRSYATAIVLHDPGSLWPGVIRTVREAGRRLGEYPEVRQPGGST